MTTRITDEHFRIHHMVTQHLPMLADHIAIMTEEGSWTYQQLAQATQDMAAQFQARGLQAGDRVLIVGEGGAAQLIAVLACSVLDAWSVPVNARMTANEIDTIKAHCAPRFVVLGTGLSTAAQAHAQRYGAVTQEQESNGNNDWVYALTPSDASARPEPIAQHCREQVAMLIYTSGTTGTPKGVMLTHSNLGNSAMTASGVRGTGPTDHVYSALPLSHAYGISTVTLAALNAGARLQLASRFDVSAVIDALNNGVSMLHGVPAMYLRLLQAHEQGHAIHAPNIRLLHCGGAPLDPSLKNSIESLFKEPINNGYGLTEASPTITMVPYRQRRDDLSVGYVIPGVDYRIVDEQGQSVAAGEVGELLVRGPNIMQGYYKNPQETARVLDSEGWLRTEDLVSEGPDGALFIKGRLKELIIRSGFNVYPTEVEAALNAHPAVHYSCVVGVHLETEERIAAFIVLKPGHRLGEQALGEFTRERLTPYKRPQHVVFVEHLPLATNGKVLRNEVQRMAQEHIESMAHQL